MQSSLNILYVILYTNVNMEAFFDDEEEYRRFTHLVHSTEIEQRQKEAELVAVSFIYFYANARMME